MKMTTFKKPIEAIHHPPDGQSLGNQVAITFPLTVYFDGSCRLCSSEMHNIAARDVIRAIQCNREPMLNLIDCSAADFDDTALPASIETMMNMIHARDATGRWLRGVDVFVACYTAADLGIVSRILAHRFIKPTAARLYPWIVRNRYRLAKIGLHRLLEIFSARAKARAAELKTQATQAKLAFAQSQVCALDRKNCASGAGFTIKPTTSTLHIR